MIFSEQKVAQMAAFFLAREKTPMAHLKLMKLLYLADRESLARFDVPMSDDRAVAMPHGPVLSATLDLINGKKVSDDWSAWISPLKNNEVHLKKEIHDYEALDELSASEIAVLERVWDTFGHMTKYKLRDYTHHNLAEWKNPGWTSVTIDSKTTFMAIGNNPEMAESKAKHLQQRKLLGRKLFEMS